MRLHVPISRIQRLPDAVQIRLAVRRTRRAVLRLGLSGNGKRTPYQAQSGGYYNLRSILHGPIFLQTSDIAMGRKPQARSNYKFRWYIIPPNHTDVKPAISFQPSAISSRTIRYNMFFSSQIGKLRVPG